MSFEVTVSNHLGALAAVEQVLRHAELCFMDPIKRRELENRMAVRIQSRWRSYSAQLLLDRLRVEHEGGLRNLKKNRAVVDIQRCIRGWLVRRRNVDMKSRNRFLESVRVSNLSTPSPNPVHVPRVVHRRSARRLPPPITDLNAYYSKEFKITRILRDSVMR